MHTSIISALISFIIHIFPEAVEYVVGNLYWALKKFVETKAIKTAHLVSEWMQLLKRTEDIPTEIKLT